MNKIEKGKKVAAILQLTGMIIGGITIIDMNLFQMFSDNSNITNIVIIMVEVLAISLIIIGEIVRIFTYRCPECGAFLERGRIRKYVNYCHKCGKKMQDVFRDTPKKQH